MDTSFDINVAYLFPLLNQCSPGGAICFVEVSEVKVVFIPVGKARKPLQVLLGMYQMCVLHAILWILISLISWLSDSGQKRQTHRTNQETTFCLLSPNTVALLLTMGSLPKDGFVPSFVSIIFSD